MTPLPAIVRYALPLSLTLYGAAAAQSPTFTQAAATATSSRSVTVSWTVTWGKALPKRVVLERITAAGGPATPLKELPPGTTRFDDPGRQPGTRYGYRLRALAMDGQGPSVEVFTRTPDEGSGGRPSSSRPATLVAHTDAAELPPIRKQREELAIMGRIWCRPLPASPVPDLQGAERNFRDLMKHAGGASAVSEFDRSAAARRTDHARDAAASALLRKDPHTAALAFLAAARLEPANPEHLVNAAGVLNTLRLPNEALTLLNAAAKLKFETAPMGIPLEAIASNNRGHALVLLGRWADAEGKLRAARKNAPHLSEASANLTVALLCQGKLEAATEAQRESFRRTPEAASGVKDVPTDGDPAKPDLPKEEIRYRREARATFDMRGGQGWNMPHLKLAASHAEAMQYKSTYDRFMQVAQTHVEGPRHPADHEDLKVVKRRRAFLFAAISGASYEPELRRLKVAMIETGKAVDAAGLGEELSGNYDRCVAQVTAYLSSEWRPKMVTFENATARYADAYARHVTALIANEGDPEVRRVWLAQQQRFLEGLFYNLSFKAQRSSRLARECVRPSDNTAPTEAAEPQSVQFDQLKLTPCQQTFGDARFALKLSVVEVKLSCGALDVKASHPAGAFVSASSPFTVGGPLTLMVGVEASKKLPLNVAGVSAKTGIALVIGSDGVQDVAWQTSAEAKVGLTLSEGAASGTTEVVNAKVAVSVGVASGLQFSTPGG